MPDPNDPEGFLQAELAQAKQVKWHVWACMSKYFLSLIQCKESEDKLPEKKELTIYILFIFIYPIRMQREQSAHEGFSFLIWAN